VFVPGFVWIGFSLFMLSALSALGLHILGLCPSFMSATASHPTIMPINLGNADGDERSETYSQQQSPVD